MAQSKSSSSGTELLLSANNWITFSRYFILLVQEQKGSMVRFMTHGELPISHPFNQNCIYLSTDAAARTMGSPTDVWTSLDGQTFKRVKVATDRDASECRKIEIDFNQSCIQVASKLMSAMKVEIRDRMSLLPEWEDWVSTGRVDHMWKKLKDTFLSDSTSVVKPAIFSFHMGKCWKQFMSITQGTQTLAAYTTTMQRELDRMVNAGLPFNASGGIPGNQYVIAQACFTYLMGLNYDTFKDDLLDADKRSSLDPDKITWAETLALATKWQGARERTENSLRNNGNPVTSVVANVTSVAPTDKPGLFRQKKKGQEARQNVKTSVMKTCRICGYNCGHTTAECSLVSGTVKERLLSTEAKNNKYYAKQDRKKEA